MVVGGVVVVVVDLAMNPVKNDKCFILYSNKLCIYNKNIMEISGGSPSWLAVLADGKLVTRIYPVHSRVRIRQT